MNGSNGSSALASRVRAAVAAHRSDRGALLPILHRLQAEMGYVDPDAIPLLAHELNLSRAEVHGVVTFYKDFRQTRPGRSTLRICRAEACQAVGAERLVAHARKRLGVELGETTADGAVTLEQVFCLGNCALGPAVLAGERLLGRVDERRFDTLVEAARGSGA